MTPEKIAEAARDRAVPMIAIGELRERLEGLEDLIADMRERDRLYTESIGGAMALLNRIHARVARLEAAPEEKGPAR